MEDLKEKIKKTCAPDRIACRLIASWFALAASVAFGEGSFTELSFAQGMGLPGAALRILCFFAIFTAAAMLLPGIHTDSWYLLLLAVTCAGRWLTQLGAPTVSFGLIYESDAQVFWFLLALILVLSLVFIFFFRSNAELIGKVRPGARASAAAAGIAALLSAAAVSLITCLRCKTFAAPNYDFGLFCQMFHYMKTTGLPLVTCERDVLLSHFAVHISPVFYLLLPFYALFPSPMTLQIAQAVLVFSGAVPLYLLCRAKRLGGRTTLALCVLFALYPAVSCGCFYDFHENCFLLPLLLWMFWAHETDRPVPMFLFALGVLSVKEDAAIYVILFAVYVLLSGKSRRRGLLLAALGAAWFVGATLILNHTAGYWAEYYKALGETANPPISGVMVDRFGNLIAEQKDGLLGAVKTALLNPGYLLTQLFKTKTGGIGKLVYLLQMLLPLGGIPLCTKRASRWLLAAPLLVNLLTLYPYQYNIGFQYSFVSAAFLFYAAALNVGEYSVGVRRQFFAVGAAACLCLYAACVLPECSHYMNRWNSGKETYTNIAETLDALPEDASLCVSSHLIAYVSDRDEVYDLTYHGNAPDVDYVVIYYSTIDYSVKRAYLAAGYTVWQDTPGEVLILKRGS